MDRPPSGNADLLIGLFLLPVVLPSSRLAKSPIANGPPVATSRTVTAPASSST
jgi:hypothetical protein